MAVEKITPQLVKKGKGKKRPGYRGPGGYQGGGGRSSRSSGPAGGASAGGNYGGNRNPSQSYGGSGQGGATRPNPHTTSGTSKTSKVSAKDIARSKREFIQNLNHNNAIRAAQTGQKFTPYKGGSRPKGGMSGLGNLLMSGIGMLMGIPGLGLLTGGFDKLKGGLGSLNDKIQSTDFARSKTLMDYLDAKKYGGIDARNKAASKNMREARGIQTAMDMRPTTLDPREMARMGLQTIDKPTQTFSFDNSGMMKNQPTMMEEFYSNLDNRVTGLNVVPNASDLALQTKTFNTPEVLMGITGATEDKLFGGKKLSDQGKALEAFRNSAVNFYNSPNNTANTAGAALGFMTDPARAGISKYDSIRENKDFIQNAINQGFLQTEDDYANQLPLDQIDLKDGGLASMFTRRG